MLNKSVLSVCNADVFYDSGNMISALRLQCFRAVRYKGRNDVERWCSLQQFCDIVFSEEFVVMKNI